MKQLIAKHPATGQTIIQRYIDGVRYLKITPDTLVPLILEGLKRQFVDKPVSIEQSKDGWIRIDRTGEDETLKKAGKKVAGDREVDEIYILEKEGDMLKQQGFIVKIEEIG